MSTLIQAGVVTNKYKNIHPRKCVFTLALGPKEMYEFMNDNLSMEVYPASYVNDPYIVGQIDKFVSVNAMIEVDLSGQVNAEYMLGRQYSAPGGQLDFVWGAYRSKGGKTFIAASSTAAHGKVSRIVAKLAGPVTDPRMDVE